MLLKFDDVLKKQDLPTTDVEVPEWGGSVRVRHWTLSERNEFQRRVNTDSDKDGVGAWLVSILAVNEDGGVWCPADKVAELHKKNPKPVDALVNAILELNRVTKEDVDDAVKK